MSRAVRNISELVVKTDKYSVIILATSYSSRMKSCGARSLLPITDKANLIDKQIEYIRHVLPGAEIVLVTGHEADKVMNKTANDIIKIENIEYTELETVRSLGIGLRAATKEHIVILPGHLAFQKETLKSVSPKSSLIICEENDSLNIGCCINDNLIENLHFDLPNKWSGIGCFSGKELEYLCNFSFNRAKDRLFLFEAINYVINKGGKIIANRTVANVVSVESTQEMELVRKIMK